MWRKIISLTAMVIFFVSMTVPVSGHNGVIVIPNQFDPSGDEHPWGGGEQAATDPVEPFLGTTNIPPLTNNFFIDLTIYRSWITVKTTALGIFEPDKSTRQSVDVQLLAPTQPVVRNR